MKIIFMAFLLLFSSKLFAKSWSDSYVLIVGDLAIRKSHLALTQKYLSLIRCANPDGILANSFRKLRTSPPPSAKEFTSFFQLMVYSDSYKIPVNEKIKQLLELSITKRKCDVEKERLKDAAFFSRFIQLELFLRSRFLTGPGNTDKTQAKNMRISLASLLESLKDQIRVEVLD